MADDKLASYRARRDFTITSEPRPKLGGQDRGRRPLSFVVQKHAASHLHYDFRLELDGTLLSWAVPKGPSLDSKDKRLALQVEDHPVGYGGFEGTIPAGQYGAGSVIVWDRGQWTPQDADPAADIAAGKLKFALDGEKLKGHWTLIRTRREAAKPQWLLIKEHDEFERSHDDYDVTEALPDSVISGASVDAKPAAATQAARRRTPAIPQDEKTMPVSTSKKASAAKPASAAKKAAAAPALLHGLKITHPDRIIDPSSGITKLEVAAYYESVAPHMLPHLRARPVALVRAPEGIGGELFFQKHLQRLTIPKIRVLDASLDAPNAALMVIDHPSALVGAAQMGVVEIHTWNAVYTALEKPDRIVFDLDPGEGVAWAQVIEAAELVKTLLDELGLASFVKTSGGKGLHIVVPLQRRLGWDACKDFSQAVTDHLADTLPDRFSAKMGAKNRVGKVFVDYLRNNRGATSACAFSARARPGLGVSMPLAWNELVEVRGGDHWTIRNAMQRLSDLGCHDPWADYERRRQTLTAARRSLQDLTAKA